MKERIERRTMQIFWIYFFNIIFIFCCGTVFAQKLFYTGAISPPVQQKLSPCKTYHISQKKVDIIIDHNSHSSIRLAKELLIERVNTCSANITNKSGLKLKIYLGKWNDKCIENAIKKYDIQINHSFLTNTTKFSEGYAVRCIEDNGMPVIVAAGVDYRGAYYAAMTLLQSIGVVDGKMIIQCSNINDYSVWKHRFLCDQVIPNIDKLSFMTKLKGNGFAYQLPRRWGWRGFGKNKFYNEKKKITWRQALAPMKQFREKYGLVDYLLLLNIYAEVPRKNPVFDITSEKDIQDLIDRCEFAVEMGFNNIMILADDWTPTYEGGYVC